MGKKRRLNIFSDPEKKAKRREMKELKIMDKENEAVGKLTLRLMKSENLTWEQVWECYE